MARMAFRSHRKNLNADKTRMADVSSDGVYPHIWTAIPSLAEMDMKGQYHVGRSTQVRSASKLFHGIPCYCIV